MAPTTPGSAQDKSVAPPTEPWAAQTSFGEITLVWGAAPGAAEYRISSREFSRSAGQGRRYVVLFKGTDTLQYYVQSLDSKGHSSEKVAFNPVVPVTEEALPRRPTRPSSVSAAETSPGEITVTWTPVEGATAYLIGRTVFPKGHGTLCALCSNATRYVDRDVEAGVEHTYGVTAFTPAGTTQRTMSNPVTPSGEKGRAPIDLRAVRSSPTSITLSWPAVSGALRYTIRRSRDDGAFEPVATLSKTEYFYPVKPERRRTTVYRFELISEGPKGEVAPPVRSDPITVDSTAGTPPAGVADVPPKGTVDFRAVRSSPTSITLSWPAVSGALRYTIRRSRDDGAFEPVATLSKTEYFYPVKPERRRTTVYRFELISEGPKGEVAPPVRSDPITVDSTAGTPPAGVADVPPKGLSDLKATIVSPTSVRLTWPPGLGYTSFRIKRTVGSMVPALIATLAGTVSSFLDHVGTGGFAAGIRYEIEAVDAKGSAEKATVAIAPEKGATDSAASTPSPKGLSDLKATVVSPTSVRLTWLPGIGTTSFRIRRTVGSMVPALIATLAGTVSSFLDHLPSGSFAAGIRYEIEAVDAKGSLEKTTVAIAPEKAATDTAVSTPSPKGLSDLKAAVVSPTSVRLTWLPGIGTTSFRIRRTVGSMVPALIATLAGTVSSFLDHLPSGSFAAGIRYEIEAVDAKGSAEKATVSIAPEKGAVDTAASEEPPDVTQPSPGDPRPGVRNPRPVIPGRAQDSAD